MINKITFNDSNPLGYESPECLPSSIEFKDGINVLVGKNGSGKSTIINLIKHYTLCAPKTFGSSVYPFFETHVPHRNIMTKED